MNLHSESTLLWERSHVACNYCKFQAKSPKNFFTFNEIWIISVTQNMLHELHAKKLIAQIYPPSVITYIVKVHLPHETFTPEFFLKENEALFPIKF
jgi:uncharacterized protein YqfB (UPF0267 family)